LNQIGINGITLALHYQWRLKRKPSKRFIQIKLFRIKMLSIFRITLLFLTISNLSAAAALASHDAGSSTSAAGSSSMSSQVNTCPSCDKEIEEGDDRIQCEQGHATHQNCLSAQIGHTKNIKDLKEHGLRCRETQCTQKHPFDKVVKALTSAQIEEINKTLVKKELRKIGVLDESCAICLENHQFKKEIVKLGCDCKKSFCQECIQTWLQSRRDGGCPTCRAPFNGITVHQLDASLEIIDPSLVPRPLAGQANVMNAEQAPVAAAVQAPQNQGVPQPMLDVNRVNLAFAALGDMYESGGLIWSGVAPRSMNWQDAINYCTALGGGARLPTAHEYRALSLAMSPGGYYNANLLPETRDNWFWSSSLHGVYSLYFYGSSGYVGDDNRYYEKRVCCVQAAGH
jgi:hypothetical protein